MTTLGTIASNSNIKLKFAGHETFPFRYGWLKKAVDCVEIDPKIFNKDEAIVEFGVGKNMVKSIKYWGLATQVLEECKEGLQVSDLGSKLLEKWDPYLEDPASLWLIHWFLVTNPSRAAVWYIIFNRYTRHSFTKTQLAEFCLDLTKQHDLTVNSNTINRDIDCFIRTYLPAKNSKAHFEETYSCPLNELTLLDQQPESDNFQFSIGQKKSLPKEIAGYALLNYISNAQNNRKTISVSDCLYREGSPGQVFKLNENSLVEYIEELYELTGGAIELDDTAGLKQIYSKKDYSPYDLLTIYYS